MTALVCHLTKALLFVSSSVLIDGFKSIIHSAVTPHHFLKSAKVLVTFYKGILIALSEQNGFHIFKG